MVLYFNIYVQSKEIQRKTKGKTMMHSGMRPKKEEHTHLSKTKLLATASESLSK